MIFRTICVRGTIHGGGMEKRLFGFVDVVRNRHIFMLDVAVLLASPAAALALRTDSVDAAAGLAAPLAVYTAVSLCVKLCVFHSMRFYDRYWRYASVDEAEALAVGTTAAGALCVVAALGVLVPWGVLPPEFPASVPVIDAMLAMILIGGVRVALRLAYVLSERDALPGAGKRVLIAGAGLAGSMIVKELHAKPQFGMTPVGFVDDDPAKQNLIIHGVSVLGPLSGIAGIVEGHAVDEVIIAMPAVSGKTIRRIVEACRALNVKSRTIPGIFEILSGSAVAQLREVAIDDLLRRESVHIDEQDVATFIRGARVMVTGAGGSIGSELCRQIVKYRPAALVMLGHGENSIFQIANELRSMHGVVAGTAAFTPVIADVRDRPRMMQVLDAHKPQIIFHAAAHKHVGLMETNIADAVTNNILGTRTLIELASAYGVEKFVMISSDKAVNPMCVMGVTKRVAELVVRDAAVRNRKPFVVVRFGNVLGSRGSIVPILREQIARGGPVTVTHPEVTRFFMTIPEAVQLVLQAGAMGTCGETFVLDMGKPVRIVDLARDLIRLSGLTEGTDIDIVYTGLKGGEKMHEELFYSNEQAERSPHEKIFLCRNGHAAAGSSAFGELIDDVVHAAASGDVCLTEELLGKIVIQYHNGGSPQAVTVTFGGKPASAPSMPVPAAAEGRTRTSPANIRAEW